MRDVIERIFIVMLYLIKKTKKVKLFWPVLLSKCVHRPQHKFIED